MNKITILQGLPYTGKTSWAEKQENSFIITRSKSRERLFGEKRKYKNLGKKQIREVQEYEEKLIRENFQKKNIIINGMNLTNAENERWLRIANEEGIKAEYKNFESNIDDFISKNQERKSRGEEYYDETSIKRDYEKATDKEGNLPSWTYSPNSGRVSRIPRTSINRDIINEYNKILAEKKPLKGTKVAIIDIDGTLANNAHHVSQFLAGPKKDFYSFFKSIKDAPTNEKVVKMIKELDHDEISSIVLTGREDSAALELIQFIERSGAPISRVLVKEAENQENDYEFKKAKIKELEEEGLTPVIAIDDRPRSVKLWKDLGIPVEQVEWFEQDGTTYSEPFEEPSTSGRLSSGSCVRCGRSIKRGVIGPTCAKKQ